MEKEQQGEEGGGGGGKEGATLSKKTHKRRPICSISTFCTTILYVYIWISPEYYEYNTVVHILNKLLDFPHCVCKAYNELYMVNFNSMYLCNTCICTWNARQGNVKCFFLFCTVKSLLSVFWSAAWVELNCIHNIHTLPAFFSKRHQQKQ